MDKLKAIKSKREQHAAWLVEWKKADLKVTAGEWSTAIRHRYLDTVYRAIFS